MEGEKFQPQKRTYRLKSQEVKRNNLPTVLLFLGTVFLSLFFWASSKRGNFLKEFFPSESYEIVNPRTKNSEMENLFTNLKEEKDVVGAFGKLTGNLSGTYGIWAISLKNETTYGINENEEFKAASVNKIPIMLSFYKAIEEGKISESDDYQLVKEDIQDYGTGSMRYEEPGKVYTYRELLSLTGKESDNTASFVLLKIIGRESIEELLTNQGFKKTSMVENTTTPKEMAELLVEVYKGKILSEEYKEEFFEDLSGTLSEERIPAGIPENIKVAHKIGTEEKTVHDCGIVLSKRSPFVLCILSKEVVEDEALKILPKISRVVWEYESWVR